ncbi:MAG: hypothetical protein K1X88_23595 [Nannocystaceae bacterium]|nr:hypothetical protein [Nannocystaceae bacterium]
MSRVAIVSLALLGCAPRGSVGSEPASGSGSGGAGTAASHDGSSDGSGEASGSGGHGSSGTSTGSSTAGASSSSSSADASTGAGACELDGSEDACLACRKNLCCDEWAACAANEVCTCIDDCIEAGGDAAACTSTHCAGPDPDYDHLHQCTQSHCVDLC